MSSQLPLVMPLTFDDRPKKDERITVRVPKELVEYIKAFFLTGGITVNDFCLHALEQKVGLLTTYRLSLYSHLMPTLQDVQRRHCQTLSAGVCMERTSQL